MAALPEIVFGCCDECRDFYRSHNREIISKETGKRICSQIVIRNTIIYDHPVCFKFFMENFDTSPGVYDYMIADIFEDKVSDVYTLSDDDDEEFDADDEEEIQELIDQRVPLRENSNIVTYLRGVWEKYPECHNDAERWYFYNRRIPLSQFILSTCSQPEKIRNDQIDSVLAFFFEIGSSPNIQDAQGRTAFHYLMKSMNRNFYLREPKFICLFLQYGAELNIQDHKGKTPLSMCTEGLKETFYNYFDLKEPDVN